MCRSVGWPNPAVFLILLSIFTFYWNSKAQSFSWRYDDRCANRLKQFCNIKVIIPIEIPKGSILFFQLNGFSQSDRMYLSC